MQKEVALKRGFFVSGFVMHVELHQQGMKSITAKVSRHESAAVPGLFYTVRVSSRALHPRLKMVPHEGLVVVVPQRYDIRHVDTLVVRHCDWIGNAMARIDSVHASMDPSSSALLPETVAFQCTEDRWRVVYRKQEGAVRVKVVESPDGELVLRGRIENAELCRSALRLWLNRRAGSDLVPLLQDLAVKHRFSFEKTAVRLQKSRWGSCTSRGTISLNSKLLFLPRSLAESVMLHELCHTVHMNHSVAFKELLTLSDPSWREHDRELKTAWKYVPRWVEA